jgi:hypothetical protein
MEMTPDTLEEFLTKESRVLGIGVSQRLPCLVPIVHTSLEGKENDFF